jgi:hypothetical protein
MAFRLLYTIRLNRSVLEKAHKMFTPLHSLRVGLVGEKFFEKMSHRMFRAMSEGVFGY